MSDLVNIIYFVTIISISYFVFELVYLHGFDLSKATELSSVFSGRNIFGMFICLGLSASLYRNFRSNSSTHNYGFSLILFYSTILILLGSRSSMISMVIGILAFYYYNKSIGKPLLIGAVITLLLMSVSVLSYDYLSQNIRFLNSNSTADDSNLIRVVLIMAAVDLFLNNPLLGVGANMFIPKSAIFLEYLNTDGIISVDLSAGLATHNSYIQYLVELGLIVTIIVILKIIKLIFTLIKLRKRSLSKTQRLELAFIFAFSLNIITSAAFMNLHSSIIFMFVILVAEKMAKQVYFANNLN
ncbi:O-antigen ligase family protein [Amylibacter sp.]|nr:O-antigen ligase family protein [Amylibacter sp.]